MVFVLGILLIGSHFFLLMGFAHFCATQMSGGGLFVLLGGALLSGLAIIRLQTYLEAFFIRRHLKRNPNSGWGVVVANHQKNAAQKNVSVPQTPAGESLLGTLMERLRIETAPKAEDLPLVTALRERLLARVSGLTGLLRKYLERQEEHRVLRREQPCPLGGRHSSPAR